jgi:hypothetical protein
MLRRRPEAPATLFGRTPQERLDAARALRPKEATNLRPVEGWPSLSPGARNAWLLLVTTKPPKWADPLVPFPQAPLSLGEPHPGFLYPDPIGFWAEVRRWCAAVVGTRVQGWDTTEAVSVSALVHLADEPGRLAVAVGATRPSVVLCLDEPAWQATALGDGARLELHHVPDPHRDGQVYQGCWGRAADGTIIGKAPQHPTMHRLYRWPDMARFLDSCPTD